MCTLVPSKTEGRGQQVWVHIQERASGANGQNPVSMSTFVVVLPYHEGIRSRPVFQWHDDMYYPRVGSRQKNSWGILFLV